MTSTEAIARFAADIEYDRLPPDVREATKRRLLDALGVGLRHRDSRPVESVRRGLLSEVGENTGASRLWGSPATASASRAATINAVSVASGNGPTFLTPTPARAGGSIVAVLAAADSQGATGEETIAGIATALELHGECARNAPLDGWDPATHTAVAAAVGAGRTVGLEEPALEHAAGIAASRVTLSVGSATDPVPTGTAASAGLQACSLAESGVTAADALSAPNGWHDLVGPFDLDFDFGCERVRDTAVLPYDATPYEQPAIGAAIELASDEPVDPADIDAVTVETFDAAVEGIDPGRIAAALVDRELAVYYGMRTDLKPIAESVTVDAVEELTERAERGGFPARVAVEARDGTVSESSVEGFDGHPSTPASWGTVEEKFHAIVGGTYDRDRREEIVRTVRSFEAESAGELGRLLG